MANNLMLNVDDNFDVNNLAEQLADTYRGRGFTVKVLKMKNGACSLVLDKGVGGINMLLGLGLGVKVTLTAKNGMLNVNYSDADWIGKIIGLAVGWFLCLIPFITAIIGSFKQLNLTKEISNDITMLAC